MLKRWFVALTVTLISMLILLLWLVAAPALWSYLHPTFPPTVVCQPVGGAATPGSQRGQPVVLAVVHASRYRETAGGIHIGATLPVGPQTTNLCALRPSDGVALARFDIGHGDDSFTRIVQVGATWYLSGTNSDTTGNAWATLCAINAGNGATRWCFINPARESGEDAFAATLSAAGRLVYIRTPDMVYGLEAVVARAAQRGRGARTRLLSRLCAAGDALRDRGRRGGTALDD